MHFSIDPAEIKYEIENLGHTVTNIYIKQNKTKLPLPMFFVDLKPASNNKDIFQIEYLQQCKITFEPPKQKRDIAQCANCQRYGHTNNYCHHTPRCVKCASTHLTSQCPARNAPAMSVAFFVVVTTLQTTRAVWSTRTSKRRHTSLFAQKYTPHLQTSNKPYTHNLE
jgi:hypothetical protein